METICKLKVDLVRPSTPLWVNAVQNDALSRTVQLTLLADGQIWLPPDGVSTAIAFRRPNGTTGLYDTLADGTAAAVISGNVVTARLAAEMFAAAGTVTAAVVLFSNGARLSTFPFFVKVEADPSAGNSVSNYPAGATLGSLKGAIGDLSQLTTTDKTSLVTALNELAANAGSTVTAGGTADINIRKWFGKKIIVDGSSITSGGTGNTQPTWHSFLKDMFALDTVYNHSLSGSGWFIGGETTTMDRVAEYEEDADAVILMGDYNGIYNYTRGVGTIDDEPSLDGMCYARLKYLAETLIAKYPLCPIIWVIEPPRASVGETDGLVPMNHSGYQQAYSAIIEEVAELYGFAHCNLMKNTVFRPWIQANYDATTSDGTHPWNNIQRTMAQVIAETMKRTPLIYNESYVVTPDYSGNGSESSGENTGAALTNITATALSGYSLFESDTLDTVKNCIRVVAAYSDLSEAAVTDYTVAGSLTAGEQTFTIAYGDVSTTITLTVTAGQRTVSIELLEQNVTEGYYIAAVGSPTTLSGYGYTDYIAVTGGTAVTFSSSGGVHGLNAGFHEYDAEKNRIQAVDTSYGTYTYTLSENTAYIRCNVKLSTSNILTFVAP